MDATFLDSLMSLNEPREINSGIFGAVVDKIGPLGLLGQQVNVPAARKKYLLGYTDAAGAVLTGEGGFQLLRYKPAATDIEISIRPNCGDSQYMLVFNGSGADLVQGVPVKKSLSATAETEVGEMAVQVALAADPSEKVVGIPQITIPDGFYGYVLVKGPGLVRVPATTPAGSLLVADTTEVAVAGAGIPAIAMSIELAGGTDGVVNADVDCS